MNATVAQEQQTLQMVEREPRPVQPLAEAPPRPAMSAVQYALQSGASVEQVQTLLELQVRADNHQLDMLREKRRMDEEDRKRDAKLAFGDAMAKFRGVNVVIPKSKRVDRGRGGSFMQAEFDAVVRLLSPALSMHGLSFRHDMKFGSRKWVTDGVENDIPWVYVTCFLEHKAGHFESLSLEGPPAEQDVNSPVQNMQVTASVLKRQSLLAITGTATGGEDDESRLRKSTADEKGGGADESDALLDAGRNAAMQGMKTLTDWWGALNAKQRTALSREFPGLRNAAKAADDRTAP